MLSERLGIAEQQVQRYEATTYAGVSIERVEAVADAVGLRITEELTYHIARTGQSIEAPSHTQSF